jgi:hypothetical protein
MEQDKLAVLLWPLADAQVFTQMEKWLSPALRAFIDTATMMQW